MKAKQSYYATSSILALGTRQMQLVPKFVSLV